MKIEIDLNEILGDEYGSTETLQESIQRQIIESLTKKIQDGVKKQVDNEVSRVITEEIAVAVKSQMPEIVSNLMNAEYLAVDRWGDSTNKTTTFRAELVKAIHEQMVYKRTQYESDKNTFTKAVDSVIQENMKSFQTEFNKLVTDEFSKGAMEYARTTLAKKLGLSV